MSLNQLYYFHKQINIVMLYIKHRSVRILLYLTVACCMFFLPACTGKNSSSADNIVTQAKMMSSAFLKEDFATVADYTSPLVLNISGGKSNLIESLKKSIEAMKIQGMTFKDISFGKPSGIIEYNGQLQATLPQETEIRYSGGTMKSNSLLIALSEDNGQTWKFIDTAGRDAATIRSTFPSLSPSLNIPAVKTNQPAN